MGTPFAVTARCEVNNVEPKSTWWASLKIDPRGAAMEAERAPLALALVMDTSGSMQGPPLAHVVQSAGLLLDLLGEKDQVALVTFDDNAAVVAGLTTVDDAGRAALKATLARVVTGGATNMHGGLSVGAGVLVTAPAHLRRAMVLMSDGQPNRGLRTVTELATFVKSLGLAVSTLGFGAHHDENVLDGIATAGSGRYAYISDPVLARVELARAALAHGGIVADRIEVKLRLAEGVEIAKVLPATPLRVGGGGVTVALGDVFIDAGRAMALELALDLPPRASGELAEVIVTGRSPDGATHEARCRLVVDVRSGAAVVDRDAQREVVILKAEAARVEARAQADRRAYPAAAAVLKAMIKQIDALDGFVANDGSQLAELREQLQDEANNFEKNSSDEERVHQRKASIAYQSPSVGYVRAIQKRPAVLARIVGEGSEVAGQTFELMDDNRIGRSAGNDIAIASHKLSRTHARILFVKDHFELIDNGSTNGCAVNHHQILSGAVALKHGDHLSFGGCDFRFELENP